MIVLRRASTPPLASLFDAKTSPSISTVFSNVTQIYTEWMIADWSDSPSALLFLVEHETSGERRVIKMLRSYQDTRYSLETLEKRQQCLLEGLERNRVFAPELYLGLAPVYHLDLAQGTICIGETMRYPTQMLLDFNTEYVLLMRPQEQENRLDYLLDEQKTDSLVPLAQYVAEIHNQKAFDLLPSESLHWGNYDYLMRKLEHNFGLLGFLIDRCSESEWNDHKEITQAAIWVKTKFQEVVKQGFYHQYFHMRVSNGYIRLCHGDIKSPHIWIELCDSTGKLPWTFNLLDAIDFNDMYNHIDILSDFAMLIADVQARTQSSAIVDQMIASYLHNTNQDDEVARTVLDYYIMEKAIVGTAISIIYDDKAELGRSFLKVAQNRLQSMCSVGVTV